jgi:hypothetical protein
MNEHSAFNENHASQRPIRHGSKYDKGVMAHGDGEMCSYRLTEQGFFSANFFACRILDEHLLSIGKTQKQMQAQIENRDCTHDVDLSSHSCRETSC